MMNYAQWLSRLREGHQTALLAPMSGITDLGFRQAAQKFGSVVTVTEMVDGEGLAAGDCANRLKALGGSIECHVVQIAGCSTYALAEAARIAEAEGAAAIDINMGCPAKKVVGGVAGSALMRDLDHAIALVRAVVAAISVPVTLKMRLGWDDATRNAPELARRAEIEGVVLVTVHGRTRCQFYKGSADWEAIRHVVDAITIPVVANGDCCSSADARVMLDRSGASAVMIGRAALGRPWLVADVAHALATGCERTEPSLSDRADAAREHYQTLIELFGPERGVRHARKHVAAYAEHLGYRPASPAHRTLVTSTDPADVLRRLDRLFAEAAERPGHAPDLEVAA